MYRYKPLLDLIGKTEGTDKEGCYNHCAYDVTLGYGAYTGGPVDLTSMTLDEVDALQTKMLKHPKNKWNSSAVGRYQIVRTTRRAIQRKLRMKNTDLYDEYNQDRMGVYLLQSRGVDDYIAGKLSEDKVINNLAKEWASLPKTDGKGYYGGQKAAVHPKEVRAALAAVKKLHLKPLTKSRTIKGAAGVTGGVTGAVIAEKNIPEPVNPGEVGEILQETAGGLMGLASYSEIIMYLFLAITVLSLGLIVYARIDDRRKEIR